jgi:hypothetical protein
MLPTRTQLEDQLVRLVEVRLLDPLEILLEGDDAIDAVRALVQRHASGWASQMLDGDDRAAVAAIVRLVSSLFPSDGPFEPPVDWWRTPMGQVLAHRVGHPTAESVSYPVAGAMLGISRQGVHDLVNRGKLARHPGGGVVPASIRDRLHTERSAVSHA